MFPDRSVEEMSSGLLRPSELPCTLGLGDVSSAKPGFVPHRILQPSVNSLSQSVKTHEDFTSVGMPNPVNPLGVLPKIGMQTNDLFAESSQAYQNFLEAVLKSLLLQLAKTEKWLPLGSRWFVGPSLSANAKVETGGDQLYDVPQGLLRFSLCIELLPSGTLIVASSPYPDFEIRRVGDVLDERLRNDGAAVGRDVILAPSGDIYSYHGEAETQISLKCSAQAVPHGRAGQALISEKHAEAHLRASVIDHLKHQGVSIPPYERWIYLRAKDSTSQARHDISTYFQYKLGSVVKLWPASLCFMECDEVAIEDVDTSCLHKLSQQTALDPLAYAETWFRAKSAREEVLKAASDKKHKEEELEARLIEEARHRDDQDTNSESVTRVDQYLSTQDASRIYPTPPDGLPSEPLGSSDTNDHQISRVGLEGNCRSRSGDYREVPAETSFPASPGFVIPSARYEQATDDDLFGEVDTGLFATSGLTDADFSFFDEPSEDEGNVEETNLLAGQSKPPGEIEQEDNAQAIESGVHNSIESVNGHLPDDQHQIEERFGFGSTVRDQQGDTTYP